MREGSQHPIASSLAQKARILLEKLMAQVDQLDNSSQPAPKQRYNPDSIARMSLETSETNDQLKHKVCQSDFLQENDDGDMTNLDFYQSLKPVPVLATDPIPAKTSAQPCQPKEPEHRQIIRRRPFTPLCPKQVQNVVPTDQTHETSEILLPPPETPLDWSLMDGYQFSFSSPHLPLQDTGVSDLGLDLLISHTTKLNPNILLENGGGD